MANRYCIHLVKDTPELIPDGVRRTYGPYADIGEENAHRICNEVLQDFCAQMNGLHPERVPLVPPDAQEPGPAFMFCASLDTDAGEILQYAAVLRYAGRILYGDEPHEDMYALQLYACPASVALEEAQRYIEGCVAAGIEGSLVWKRENRS